MGTMRAHSRKEATMRRFIAVLLVLVGLVAVSREAQAQEIQLTGPLAGAPAVRQLRLHRKGRIEVAPTISFTLLDQYQRTILAGARLNYNMTDWLALGVWGSFGAVKTTTALTDHIQDVTAQRRADEPGSVNNKLVAPNVGTSFKDQLGTISYVFAPQITAVPFRGKLAIFQKIFVDTDAYFFAGPAFVGLKERANCGGDAGVDCADPASYSQTSRMAIAPTFGLGLSFYSGKWMSFGLEWRALPFAWNTGGFDTHGRDPDGRFPDGKIDDKDREFIFNQMLSISVGFYFPQEIKTSE
jgi:hypothetical protein